MNRLITQLGQSRAILAFIVILGAVMGYLSYSKSDPQVIPDDPASSSKKDSIESWADFKLDFSILEDKTYKSLEILGENPVNPGLTGERRNPFSPI